MDIASIQTKFADELAQVRSVKSPRARKYTSELKKAIVDLNASGVPVERIQRELGLSGGAFRNWFTRSKKRQKAAFTPLASVTSACVASPANLAADLVMIELPSGASVKIRY